MAGGLGQALRAWVPPCRQEPDSRGDVQPLNSEGACPGCQLAHLAVAGRDTCSPMRQHCSSTGAKGLWPWQCGEGGRDKTAWEASQGRWKERH